MALSRSGRRRTDDRRCSRVVPHGWELSAARAAWVVRYLATKHHIDPKRMAAAGYASIAPSRTTTASRARPNRRQITVLGRGSRQRYAVTF